MPRKAITVIEKRKWLEQYEAGKTEAAIANDTKHDIRTVKKAIEETRRERVATLAKTELLKEALHAHNETLLGMIQKIIPAIVLPPLEQIIPLETSPWLVSIPIKDGKAEYESEPMIKVVQITLDAENQPEWELLAEHLKRDILWRALGQWKERLATQLEARILMKRRLAKLLEEKTGYKLADEPLEGHFIYSSYLGPVFEVVISQLLGLIDESEVDGSIIADCDRGEVRCKRRSDQPVLAEVPGAEKEFRLKIMAALGELQKSTEAKSFISSYRATEEATAKARQVAEDIRMLRLVPGTCRLCRRLGM
jgi:hypothetical protein